MKKVLLLFLFLLFIVPGGKCTDKVEKDFYLSGERNEELRPLPNTLRAELFVGESTELFAESYPEKGALSFFWKLESDDGTVSIFPSGGKCTLIANREGEETVTVYIRGGGSAEIVVRVSPAPEINVRSFESPEPEKENNGILLVIFRVLVSGLIIAGASLLSFVAIFFVRRRRK